MIKGIYRSDLASDLIENLIEHKDYQRTSQEINGIKEDTIELLQDFDDLGKKKGRYVEITFKNMVDQDDSLIDLLQSKVKEYLSRFKLKNDPLLLVVGLGNPYITSDALGPTVIRDLFVSHALSKEERDSLKVKDVMAFSPNVLAHTGMESAELIESIISRYQVDALIVIDALAARNYSSINHVIQMSDVGIYPGSGVGNHRKAMTKETLHIPILCIGVPTVVSVTNVFFDLLETLESYFAWMKSGKSKLRIGKVENYHGELSNEEKTYLLGQVGNLSDQEKRQLINEVLLPIDKNMILCDKQVDLQCELLSKILSRSLNQAFKL